MLLKFSVLLAKIRSIIQTINIIILQYQQTLAQYIEFIYYIYIQYFKIIKIILKLFLITGTSLPIFNNSYFIS